MDCESAVEMKYECQQRTFDGEVERILKLCEESTELVEEFEASAEQHKQLEAETKLLMGKLQTLRQEQLATLTEKMKYEQELKDLQNYLKDVGQDLSNIYSLLGFHLTEYKDGEAHAKEITLTDCNSDCFVKFKHSNEMYELLDMKPKHPMLSEIKEYLYETQDVRNFLEMVKKFFLIATQQWSDRKS